uniref:rab GTPase-binding effector protein 1-like n=1 Tax=Styela clava TaxID=7725 RepID=UPI0019396ED2|nr:rab GTPase-binding effector protein 1-like [Styela clava]
MDSLLQDVEDLKNRCSFLEQEKLKMQSNFEEKRSKFKEVYQTKEKLVAEQNLEIDALRMKLKQNDDKISELKMEIEDIKMIASVSENTKQEAVERLSKRHQDEIESLRKAMEDSNEESQRDMVRHFDRERGHWEKKHSTMKAEREHLESELEELRKKLRDHGDMSEEEELEASMKKAHAEAEKLKSVVLPLEQEIRKLQEDLGKTKSELKESQNLVAELNAKSLKDDNTIETESATDAQEPMLELDLSLKSEKSSRTDLERYVTVLKQQNKEMENEKDTIQEKMKNVCKQYEVEKAEHEVLKQTWLAANDQFLESQRLLMRDNNIIESVLSEEQKRQAKMLKLKAQASEARDVPAKSPTSSLALLKKKTDKFKEAVVESISDSESDSQSFGSFQDYQESTKVEKNNLSPTFTLTLPDAKIQKTVIIEPEQIDANKIVPGPDQKVVSEEEWNELLRELRIHRNKAARTSSFANASETPEKKHADLFEDDAKMVAEIESLKLKIKVYEEEKMEEFNKTKSLEESIRCSAEDAQKQITELHDKLADFERLLGNLKEKQIKVKAQDINELVSLRQAHDKYRDEVNLLRKERDKLSQLQQKYQQTLTKENVSVPKSIDGLQSLVQTYRKVLATTKAEKDALETKFKNQLAFLEERLKAEQSTRDQLETSLASELHDARGEIISLQSLKSVKDDLAKSEKEKSEIQQELEKMKTSRDALQSKSSEIIKGFREKHLAEIKAKEDVERSLAEAKNRLRSLQSALETSEHVQRDFVRLSQSLQVQLEEVREEREKLSETGSIHSIDLSNTAPMTSITQPSTSTETDQHRNETPSPKLKQNNEFAKSKHAT